MKRILGIDPGSRTTGYGIIDVRGDRAAVVLSGVIKTGKGEFPERLGIIFHGVRELIVEHRPDEVAVENVFVSKNASSALKLGQARGAAICAAISAPNFVAWTKARWASSRPEIPVGKPR